MLADLDETIRELLVRYVPLNLSEVDVTFDAPDRDWSGRLTRPTVNCFLYEVQENLDRRDLDYEVQRGPTNNTAVRKQKPLRFDASYYVTTWARAPEDEHRLLWRVLSAFCRFRLLPPEILKGGLTEQPYPMTAQVGAPNRPDRVRPADLWQALENRLRPALTYVVTLALDPQVATISPLVFTRTLRFERIDHYDPTDFMQIGGRVTVRGDGGQGVPGTLVRLRETGSQAVTDEDGQFWLRRVPRGPVTLLALPPDRPEVIRSVEVPSSTYDLEV